jgi:2-polyprenyl-6-methoxyphenol hydroxylase-like FAD-dependent oxidoreductase
MKEFDAIVVGARVSGAPLAMLLDRAAFPSDTISSHLIHAPGMNALARWGLAERVLESGCPPVHTYRLDFGPVAIVGRPVVAHGPVAHGPRRRVLDAMLVEAAAAAGANVRERVTATGLIVEDGVVRGIRGRDAAGTATAERATIVVGADGVNSFLARAVKSESYDVEPAAEVLSLAYWSGMPTDGEFQLYAGERRAAAAVPTNDGLTVVLAAWPIDEFEANRSDLAGNYVRAFDAVPGVADRIRGTRRESPVVARVMHNFRRVSHGPGWVLAGDAAFHKDAVTAQGITDAFHDAEGIASAIVWGLSGRRPLDVLLAEHEADRDRRTAAMYRLTRQLASFEPPDPDTLALFGAVAADPAAADRFASMLAGIVGVDAFFASALPVASPDAIAAGARTSDLTPAFGPS